jgi:hypothetical protein
VSVIIGNATPLIAFARIGQLALLQKVVQNMTIPKAVAHEISEYVRSTQGIIDLSQESWITVQPVQSEQQVRQSGAPRQSRAQSFWPALCRLDQPLHLRYASRDRAAQEKAGPSRSTRRRGPALGRSWGGRGGVGALGIDFRAHRVTPWFYWYP